jgi:DNA-binding response OmpR family regulator
LRMGADDYVAKPFLPAELIARVTAVLRRAGTAPQVSDGQPVLRMGDVELDAARLTVRTSGGREADLTPTETKLLHCLMRNAGMVLSRDTLLDQVWGHDYEGDSNVVDVYIRRVRHKLESDPNDPRYIRTVRGAGYSFRVE